jgi:hypothetical protein
MDFFKNQFAALSEPTLVCLLEDALVERESQPENSELNQKIFYMIDALLQKVRK